MSIRDMIESKYSSHGFLAQKKALYLFNFNLMLLIILPIALVAGMITRPERIVASSITVVPIITAALVSIFLVLREKSKLAGIILSSVMGIGIMFLVFSAPRGESLSNAIYYVFGYLLVILLFSNRIVLTISAAAFIIGTIPYYYTLVGRGVDPSVILPSLTGFPISVVMFYVLAILLVGTLNNAIKRTEDESEKNRKLLGINEALMVEIKKQIVHLSSVAREVSETASVLSSGAQKQAAGIEQIAASLEEMSSTINQNAENSQMVRQITEANADTSEQGNGIALEAVQSINDVNQASKRVAEITQVINDIAFQTNLLALNAAVEAARAGEAGRGFAVVATEVRNLAQRSGGASKEIGALIKDTVVRVEKGTELVNRTGMSLADIAKDAHMTAKLIGEIAMASLEQKQGIVQVNNAINSMDQLTQSNAAASEQLSGMAESLADSAMKLQGLVSAGDQ